MRSVQGANETNRSGIVIAIWPSRFSRRSRRRSCISSATSPSVILPATYA